jgi:hypothetical protein
MQRGQCSQVGLGHPLKTLKRLNVIEEATMVPRQGDRWGGLQTVALADGETRYSLTLVICARHKPIREC